jgi:hypothetical protein
VSSDSGQFFVEEEINCGWHLFLVVQRKKTSTVYNLSEPTRTIEFTENFFFLVIFTEISGKKQIDFRK